MSYSLLGRIVDTTRKRVLCTADVSFLKNISVMRYSGELENVNNGGKSKIDDYPSIRDYVSCSFYEYLRSDILNEFQFEPYVNGDDYGVDCPKFVCDESFIEENYEAIDGYRVIMPVSDKENSDGLIMLFKREISKVDGMWYTIGDFEKALPKFVSEYEEVKKKIDKITSIRESREWYEMSKEAQGQLLDDLSYLKEDLDDCRWKKEAVEKIITILDFFQEDVGFTVDGKESKIEWPYDDKRNIELFIEVC